MCFGRCFGSGCFSLTLGILNPGLIVEIDLLGRNVVGGKKVSQRRLRPSNGIAVATSATPGVVSQSNGRRMSRSDVHFA